MNDMSMYFSGDKLYGNDFSPEQISDWFDREREGYADLGAKDHQAYVYKYHALNQRHGFRHVPNIFENVLGIGSAWGDELSSVQAKAKTILEPSEAFSSPGVRYVKPSPTGLMPFADNTFDLVVCLGVLHHIPNVSIVVQEIARCMTAGGYALVREPVISMGDWRQPRRGLTACERGIPRDILVQIFEQSGLTIEHRARCAFPLTSRLSRIVRGPVYNSRFAVWLDSVLSSLPWPSLYHPQTAWQKLQPSAEYFVLRR